ncbi:MAG: T9SS type A sorting domain-containing protein [Saprospiraceae bacterium]
MISENPNNPGECFAECNCEINGIYYDGSEPLILSVPCNTIIEGCPGNCDPANHACVNGECLDLCIDGECPEGYICETIEGFDVCVPFESECEDDNDCPFGEHCENGTCVPDIVECDIDGDGETDCANCQECIDDECVPIENCCTNSEDCPPNHFCEKHSCHECPEFSYEAQFGNNLDCMFELWITSSVSDVKVSGHLFIYLYNLETGEIKVIKNDEDYDFWPNYTHFFTGRVPNNSEPCPNNSNSDQVWNLRVQIKIDHCYEYPLYIHTKSDGIPEGWCAYCASNLVNIINEETYLSSDLEFIQQNSSTNTSETNTSNLDNFTIYPNPFKNTFTIYGNSVKVKGIEVLNSVGQNVYTTELDQPVSQYEIDFSTEPSGFYFVNLLTEDGDIVKKKVIKAR